MNDLELLREIFKDARLHIGIGTIVQLGLATDGSALRVMVNLLPENRQVVAEMTFADVYAVTLPEINDLAIVAFADGHPDDAFVIKLVNTSEEPIPDFARLGNTMIAPRTGKKVGIGRHTISPTEPLVLGNVAINGLTALVNAFLDATQIGLGPTGPVFLDPTVRAALVSFVSTYLTTPATNIASQVAFTERGA